MSIPEKNPFKEKNFEKFEDTLRLDNQYNKRFSDMVIVKGKGLTEFYDKENNCIWRLVEWYVHNFIIIATNTKTNKITELWKDILHL